MKPKKKGEKKSQYQQQEELALRMWRIKHNAIDKMFLKRANPTKSK